MNDYKEQCWKRYIESKKYENYDKEDLVNEIIDLQGTIESNTNSYNKLATYSDELQDRIDRAVEYMENYIEVEPLNEPVKMEFKEVINILKRSDKE